MKLKIYQHTHVTYSKWSRVEFKHSSSINLNQFFFFKLKLQTFKHPYSSTCIFDQLCFKVPTTFERHHIWIRSIFKNWYCRLTNPVLHLACTLFLQDILSQSLEVVNISTLDKPLHNSLLQIQSSC